MAKRYPKKSLAAKLEKADPAGRVDVLSFLATKRVVETIEHKYQLPGLWDEMKEDIARDITRVVTGKKINVPPVVMPLLRRFGIVGPNQSGN